MRKLLDRGSVQGNESIKAWNEGELLSLTTKVEPSSVGRLAGEGARQGGE
jgi:hypothetical protein